jgi:hypothetical protein
MVILLASCKSASYFYTPNEFRNITGTLYLANGQTIDGKLIVNKDGLFNHAVKIYVPGEKEAQKYNLFDVKGYSIRGQYYELREIRGGISLDSRYSFMKRLTPADSKIQLFEHTEKQTTTVNNNTSTHYETQYYMQLPQETGDAVWALSSQKFVPNFDEKMSRMVQDCNGLAKKIAGKEDGYFYAQVSLSRERRADVLWNIINEYNKCQ